MRCGFSAICPFLHMFRPQTRSTGPSLLSISHPKRSTVTIAIITKIARPSRIDYSALQVSPIQRPYSNQYAPWRGSYECPSLKANRILSRFCKGKRAHGFRGLVFVRWHKIAETLWAKSIKEPFPGADQPFYLQDSDRLAISRTRMARVSR